MCQICESEDDRKSCPYDEGECHPDQWLKEEPTDSNGRPYNPYQGSITPTDGRCNAPLSAWEDRYGEKRYCMGLPEQKFVDGGSERCRMHKGMDGLMERASEIFTHGIYSKTISHTFEKLPPMQKVVALGWYDSYVQESVFDFEEDIERHIIDFSDYLSDSSDESDTYSDSAGQNHEEGDLPLEIESELDDDEQMEVGVPVPNEHAVRCFALYRAGLADVKAGLADREVLSMEDGTTAMERKSIVDADADSGQVIKDEAEHHLNVPISRLDNDKEDLLEFGGVPLDNGDDIDFSGDVNADELILEIGEADETSNPIETEMEGYETDDE